MGVETARVRHHIDDRRIPSVGSDARTPPTIGGHAPATQSDEAHDRRPQPRHERSDSLRGPTRNSAASSFGRTSCGPLHEIGHADVMIDEQRRAGRALDRPNRRRASPARNGFPAGRSRRRRLLRRARGSARRAGCASRARRSRAGCVRGDTPRCVPVATNPPPWISASQRGRSGVFDVSPLARCGRCRPTSRLRCRSARASGSSAHGPPKRHLDRHHGDCNDLFGGCRGPLGYGDRLRESGPPRMIHPAARQRAGSSAWWCEQQVGEDDDVDPRDTSDR